MVNYLLFIYKSFTFIKVIFLVMISFALILSKKRRLCEIEKDLQFL